MTAGMMRQVAAFHRLDGVADGFGNADGGFAATPFLTVPGDLRVDRPRERLAAGRMESPQAAVLRLRWSPEAAAITPADKAVIDGVDWQVRGVTDPDGRRRWLDLSLETGVAV